MKVHCDSCQALAINGHPCHEQGCTGSFTLHKGKSTYHLFQTWTLDVWGNKRDGFEVNDRSRYGKPLTIRVDTSNDDWSVIKELKRNYMLNKFTRLASIHIDGDDRNIWINSKSGEPIYQLERL